jgi:RNA polymerase sigma-70 factor, ECF subfamily
MADCLPSAGTAQWQNKVPPADRRKKQHCGTTAVRNSGKHVRIGNAHWELVARASAGDEPAFAELYALHHRRVYWLCTRMTHDAACAEDLTQEVFLQAYRRLATYRGDAPFATWLHRVAVNAVLVHLRKRKGVEVPLDQMADDQGTDTSRPAELRSDDSRLAASVDRVALERAIDELAPGYRLCFLLHDVDGYEHQEIAQMLGISIGTSKCQLHRARLRLRAALQRRRRRPTIFSVTILPRHIRL